MKTETPIVDSGLVGFVVGQRPDGKSAISSCLEHAPSAFRTSNRMVFRDEAIADRAKCDVCGQVLATMPAEAIA